MRPICGYFWNNTPWDFYAALITKNLGMEYLRLIRFKERNILIFFIGEFRHANYPQKRRKRFIP